MCWLGTNPPNAAAASWTRKLGVVVAVRLCALVCPSWGCLHGPCRSHVYASSGVPRPLVGARDGLSFRVLSLAIRTVPRQVPRTLHLYSKSRPRGMSLIFCVFPSFISYIGNFIFVTYRGSIPLPLVSFRALANYFFSVRAAAFLAYSYYTCSAAFIRVAAKHVWSDRRSTASSNRCAAAAPETGTRGIDS